jgi:hypothetical protein
MHAAVLQSWWVVRTTIMLWMSLLSLFAIFCRSPGIREEPFFFGAL